VFIVPEKFTIGSWEAKAANLFFVGLKGSLVILLISLTTFLSKPFFVFKPVPTAVPPCARNIFPLKIFQFARYFFLIANDILKISVQAFNGVAS
jgi:hypothetical protein